METKISDDKKRILLVEDDDDLRELMLACLEEHGYVAVGTDQGAHVEELINRYMPDVALVDIGLPDIDGFTISKSITSGNMTHANTSVIIVSANADMQHKIRGFLCGAKKYVSKPFDMDDLIVQIENIIHRNLARRRSESSVMAY